MTGILPLTRAASRIVTVLGEDRAIALFLAVGGTHRNLAPRPSPDNMIVAAIGEEGALALWEEFGPNLGRVPVAKDWIGQVWYARGRNISEIARLLHVTDKTVRGWTKARRTEARAAAAERAERRAEAAARQLDLVDWFEGKSAGR